MSLGKRFYWRLLLQYVFLWGFLDDVQDGGWEQLLVKSRNMEISNKGIKITLIIIFIYKYILYFSFFLPGVISVYFEANVSSNKPQGFNASFWVRRCHQSSDEGQEGSLVCPDGTQCQGGLCQCPQGYGGPHCDRPICPQDCGITEGRGTCNIVRLNK